MLKHNIVKGFGDGGGDPSGNFSMDDLTEEQQEEINSVKGKDFATGFTAVRKVIERYATSGKISTEDRMEIEAWYEDRTYGEGIGIDNKDNILVFMLDDVIESNDIARIVFNQEGIDYIDTERTSSYDDILSFLPTDKYDEVIKYIIANYRPDIMEHAEDNGEEFSELYVRNNIDILIDDLHISPVIDSVNRADSDATLLGTESEIVEATFKSIRELCDSLSVTLPENIYDLYEKPYGIIKPESVETFLQSHIELQERGRLELDLEEPSYGFSGYSEETLKDSILYSLYGDGVLK